MKRYWFFLYDDFYPTGGMNDFYKSFDSLEECINEYNSINNTYYKEGHVFDSETKRVVHDFSLIPDLDFINNNLI